MLIIYSIIIVLTLTGVSFLILNNYKNTRIKNEEIRLFQTGNIVADTYKSNMEDIIFARFMVKSYGKQANARILVIDNNRKVIMDNYNSYMGKKLDNDEIKASLKGKSKSGLYEIEDKEVLQLSVPITMNTGLETKVIGVVLVSASMDSVNSDMENLKNNILKISTFGLIISLLLITIAANNMTKPLKTLTHGVEKISAGHLGYQVEGKYNGEIGLLIDSFNHMSYKLNSIEKNRKNLINNISHELKTPLTSIKTLIESLSFGDNDIEIYKEYLQDIYEESNRMEELVNYIMASIKLEDITLELKEENIGEILEETVKFITPYAEKNNVQLKIMEMEDIIVKCDKNKLKEVLLNILDNSIKYGDENKEIKEVKIFLVKEKHKGTIIVEDNGLGIPEESLNNIFDRDFRVLDGSFPSYKNIEGYGLGLSIVKNIIDKHKWSILVESELGLGSKFIINIPI